MFRKIGMILFTSAIVIALGAPVQAAEQLGTISYEVLCGINKRIPRIYLQGGKASEILQYIV